MDPGSLFVTLYPLSFFSFPIDRSTRSEKDGEAKTKDVRQHDKGLEADERDSAGQGDFNVQSKRDVSTRCTSCGHRGTMVREDTSKIPSTTVLLHGKRIACILRY